MHSQPKAAWRSPGPLAPLPRTPFARVWERVTRTIDPKVLAGAAVAVAVAALIVAIVLATKGGGGHPVDVAIANTAPTEVAQPETTPAETPTPATVESSQVEHVLSEYREDYSNEDLEGLKSLFAEVLERHDASKAPENLDAALATYKRQFSELQQPTYSLSEISVEPGSGEANATAQYSISSQNGTVTGSISYHLVEQDERLLIDRLRIEPSQ